MKILFVLRSILSLMFGGEKCVRCGKWTLLFPICKKCALKFASSTIGIENRCQICGKPLVSEIEICSMCRKSQIVKSAQRIFSLQTYRLWKKNLIFDWKMNDKRILSPFFSLLVEQKIREIENLYGESLMIVPVPPRPNKIKEKGWDQIQDLCFYLKFGFGRKILPLLERRSKIQQKKLGRVQRLETIGTAYFPVCEKKLKKITKNMELPDSVILLDDVMTTGSTLEDCAENLKKIGIKKIYCVTLFTVG